MANQVKAFNSRPTAQALQAAVSELMAKRDAIDAAGLGRALATLLAEYQAMAQEALVVRADVERLADSAPKLLRPETLSCLREMYLAVEAHKEQCNDYCN